MIKKSLFALSAVSCSALLLVACGGVHKIREMGITKHKLSNGHIVSVGLAKPTSAWGCVEKARKKYDYHNITRQFFTGTSKGPLQTFKRQALRDAGKMKSRINYVYLAPPSQVSVGNFDLNALADAHAFFYQCKKVKAD